MKIIVDNRTIDLDEIPISYPYFVQPEPGEHLLTDDQIKALAKANPSCTLYVDKGSDAEDTQVERHGIVHIRDGMRFYTVPPATV